MLNVINRMKLLFIMVQVKLVYNAKGIIKFEFPLEIMNYYNIFLCFLCAYSYLCTYD